MNYGNILSRNLGKGKIKLLLSCKSFASPTYVKLNNHQKLIMIRIKNITKSEFDSIPIDPFWNAGDEKELKMHRIHSYPAKFPAFIINKALSYASKHQIKHKRIADIFCGCGTVAFEAKRKNIEFFGYDINPVATMIAKVKSQKYSNNILEKYYKKILNNYSNVDKRIKVQEFQNERIRYWHSNKQIKQLSFLKSSIEQALPVNSNYRQYFLCAFSNILKSTSRWLTKSIKPQLDPRKTPTAVIPAFSKQYRFMLLANMESDAIYSSPAKIKTINILDESIRHPKVDIIITSPPYVTSYEYADLHQLSSLWLGFTEDYKSLRSGTIGSLHNCDEYERRLTGLNKTARRIHSELSSKDASRTKSVAKYFLDMQRIARTCFKMLSKNGMALFVIGDTEYKRVRIDNALHLAESLRESGFKEIFVSKRKISNKILTPYRNKRGRFTSDVNGRKVYAEEFILIGRK